MPKDKTPTQTDLVAKALSSTQKSQEALQAIDLRRTRGPVREHLRNARVSTDATIQDLVGALQSDVAR